ncbi:MAG: hypothetical protein J1E43_08165 [Christensenellaceae bacterium]|nr:hypothetical protein [Christensenellaceae bacterium]
MNKISIEVQPDACFVYHMLSVARCGYDNDYGAAHRHLHDPADLTVLKDNERLLTVAGGEHCGALYWPLIAVPARGEQPADETYRTLLERAEGEHRDIIVAVCRAMLRAYPAYMKQVYPQSRAALEPYALQTASLLGDFTDRAEALIGRSLPVPCFHALLVDSTAWGAEGIDISESQDVFGIDRTPEEEALLIEHEYVIYLLKEALRGTTAFQLDAWALTEGLASHYLAQLVGDGPVEELFAQHRSMRQAYRQLHEAHPAASARELYLLQAQKSSLA